MPGFPIASVDITLIDADGRYAGRWKTFPKKAWDIERDANGRWTFYCDGTFLTFHNGSIEGTVKSFA